MQEVWKDIENFNGQYQVSNFGNVRSVDYQIKMNKFQRVVYDKNAETQNHLRFRKGRVLKLSQDKDGYLLVSLKRKTYKVHRLIAQHFIDNPYQWDEVGHRDGNYENNNYENLYWKHAVTEEEKKQTKLNYEKMYRKKPKRIAWRKKWNGEIKYRTYVTNPKTRFLSSKKQASKRKLSWELIYEEYLELVNTKCHYCCDTLLNKTGSSLDRIDNDKGYIKSNVLPCCGTCNVIRGDNLSVEEMEIAMKAVLELRNKKGLIQR